MAIPGSTASRPGAEARVTESPTTSTWSPVTSATGSGLDVGEGDAVVSDGAAAWAEASARAPLAIASCAVDRRGWAEKARVTSSTAAVTTPDIASTERGPAWAAPPIHPLRPLRRIGVST
ncbi:MAG: hypothetical protein Q605_AUC00728G0002 [Actinomyces urogenitalis DORA_12]|uniref:Uncharacterized protein n=1 Tax=Actinomyces urogenitalis DORA_12 TaxID=1403939 RepID=W1VDV6_9ACTO|nr:MAG: hypothetical protein Q605_AUC00728G0002 [Actinomyces urogenitalis DORA_12]